jgi:hypothetical protein
MQLSYSLSKSKLFVEFSKMQGSLEHVEEMTYAGQAAAQNSSFSTANTQISQQNLRSADRNTQIYDFVTQVAERCHDARLSRVNEVNNPNATKGRA